MRARLPLLALLSSAVLLSAASCTDGEAGSQSNGPDGRAGASGRTGGSGARSGAGAGGADVGKVVGIPDVPQSKTVVVVETSLRATGVGGELHLAFRARGVLGMVKGTFDVSLKAEDGGAKVFPCYQPDAKSSAPSTTLLVSAKN